MEVQPIVQRVQDMARTPWVQRDRTMAEEKRRRGRPRGKRTVLDYERINRALAEGAPATLTAPEVRAITGYRSVRLAKEIADRAFPPPMNPEKHSWRTWASCDIRAWLIDNGLPTVFGQPSAAQEAPAYE